MSNWMITYNSSDDLMHYGVKGRSGRKKGSGTKNKNQAKPLYKKKATPGSRFGISSHKTSSGASKVIAILKLKNVSDTYKIGAIKKLYKSGIEIDKKELQKYLSKNPKMIQYLNNLKAGKVTKKKAILSSNRPRINSAEDARRYRLTQVLKKRDELVTQKRLRK